MYKQFKLAKGQMNTHASLSKFKDVIDDVVIVAYKA